MRIDAPELQGLGCGGERAHTISVGFVVAQQTVELDQVCLAWRSPQALWRFNRGFMTVRTLPRNSGAD